MRENVSRELDIEAAGNGAAHDGETFPNSDPQEPQGSGEPRSAVTRDHISTAVTDFGTMDDRVKGMEKKYEEMNGQIVQKVTSPFNLFCLC